MHIFGQGALETACAVLWRLRNFTGLIVFMLSDLQQLRQLIVRNSFVVVLLIASSPGVLPSYTEGSQLPLQLPLSMDPLLGGSSLSSLSYEQMQS